jgi:membrane protein YdbS with pleckstrin-like domain
MLHRRDRFAIPAAITITIVCVAVLAWFIMSSDPIWITADTAVIFAFGVGVVWYITPPLARRRGGQRSR